MLGRETLIQELRDAFLDLAGAAGPAATQQHAAEYEGRIRQLHVAFEAGPSKPEPAEEGDGWAISAVRSPEKGPAVHGPKPILKGAFRQPAGSTSPRRQTGASIPSPPTRGGTAGDSQQDRQALQQRSPAAAPPVSAAQRAASAPRRLPRQPELQAGAAQAAAGNGPAVQAPSQQQPLRDKGELTWQPDDGLAVFEEEERCQTPRPFHSSHRGGVAKQQQPWPSTLPRQTALARSAAAEAASPEGRGVMQQQQQQVPQATLLQQPHRSLPDIHGELASPAAHRWTPAVQAPPASPWGPATSIASSSVGRSLPQSPEARSWTPNPVALCAEEEQGGRAALQEAIDHLTQLGQWTQVSARNAVPCARNSRYQFLSPCVLILPHL